MEIHRVVNRNLTFDRNKEIDTTTIMYLPGKNNNTKTEQKIEKI